MNVVPKQNLSWDFVTAPFNLSLVWFAQPYFRDVRSQLTAAIVMGQPITNLYGLVLDVFVKFVLKLSIISEYCFPGI